MAGDRASIAVSHGRPWMERGRFGHHGIRKTVPYPRGFTLRSAEERVARTMACHGNARFSMANTEIEHRRSNDAMEGSRRRRLFRSVSRSTVCRPLPAGRGATGIFDATLRRRWRHFGGESDGEAYSSILAGSPYPDGGFNALWRPGDRSRRRPSWSVSRGWKRARDTFIGTGASSTCLERRMVQSATLPHRSDRRYHRQHDGRGSSAFYWNNGLRGPTARRPDRCSSNPTVFLAGSAQRAVGIVPLDDLFHLRAEKPAGRCAEAVLARQAPGHSRRAAPTPCAGRIYPTATNDYYDFINQVRAGRRHQWPRAGRIRLHQFTGTRYQSEEVKPSKASTFYSWASITRVLARSGDFAGGLGVHRLLRRSATGFRDVDRRFAARTIQISRSRSTWPTASSPRTGPTICSPIRLRWTRTVTLIATAVTTPSTTTTAISRPNSFRTAGAGGSTIPPSRTASGKRMLSESADYMIHNLGATSVWADGYISGYIRENYTYDQWDGVSVTIDPAKRNCVVADQGTRDPTWPCPCSRRSP